MKTALLKVIIFFALFTIVDFGIGAVLNYMQKNSYGGSIGKINYIADRAEEKIIVFGSSKGESNYNPQVFSKSLGLSCYNCSRTGNGIVLMYGRYKMLTARYTPKIIIYDVKPQFDLYEGDNSKYTVFLKPFYGRNGIDSLIWMTDPSERIKMCSQLYRFNYRFLEVMQSYKQSFTQDNGFSRNDKVMNVIPEKVEPDSMGVDSLKLRLLENLIVDCKRRGIKLIFVNSPEFFTYENYDFSALENLCRKYDVRYLDESKNSNFIGKKNYFVDSIHMNFDGATTFSNFIASLIADDL